MRRYLAWLQREAAAAGVEIRRQRVASLADVPGDLVVLAAGLGSGPLVGDASGVAVQGQVVRLADPGLSPAGCSTKTNPAGLTYVVPRGSDVVVGGTAVEGATGTAARPGRGGGRARPGLRAGARAARRPGALARGRTAAGPAHGAAGPDDCGRPAGGLLLRARRGRRHPLLGLRGRCGGPGRVSGQSSPSPLDNEVTTA